MAFLILVCQGPPATCARQGGARVAGVEEARKAKPYEHSYALVIGVADYTQGWPKLPGVKKDIEEVSRALEKQGFQVTKVENPDSSQLEKAFKEFINAYGLKPDNRLLFYFAGHGQTLAQSYGGERGYIVPADAPLSGQDMEGFLSKATDIQEMEFYSTRIQSKHALFVFDSCFSGALFESDMRGGSETVLEELALPVRFFITAGTAGQRVPDQSIFRKYFVEGIDGKADYNNDGYVTGTELGMYLRDRVTNDSKRAQTPRFGKIRNPNLDKGDFVFILPTAAPKAAAAPTDTAKRNLRERPLDADFSLPGQWRLPAGWRATPALEVNGEGRAMLREEAGRFADFELSANVELVNGTAVSFIVRAADEQNYYLVQLCGPRSETRNLLRLYLVKGGQEPRSLQNFSLRGYKLTGQFIFAIKVEGDSFRFFIDDNSYDNLNKPIGLSQVGELNDGTFAAGTVGIAAGANDKAKIYQYLVCPGSCPKN